MGRPAHGARRRRFHAASQEAVTGVPAEPEAWRRYVGLIQGLEAIFWELDPQTWTYTFVSQQAETILGYPLEPWLTDARFGVDIIHPEDRPAALAHSRRAIEEGRDHELEYRVMAADGQVVWLRTVVHVVPDEDGRPQRLYGLMIDISRRKEREEQLRESERRLAEAQRAGRLGSFEWEIQRDRVTWTDELYRIYGLEPGSQELTYAAFLEHVLPEDRDLVRAHVERALERGGPFEFEERIGRPGGQLAILRTTGEVLKDASGQPVRMVGICQDVTEQKAAEERQRQLIGEQAARAEAEAGRRRMAFLAEAGTVLAGSLDLQETFRNLAGLVVPELADWCLIDVLDEEGRLEQVAVAHADPAKAELARLLRQRDPPRSEEGHPIWRAIQTGQPDLAREIPQEELLRRAHDEEHRSMLLELGIRSHIVVPLVARGRTLGTMSFVSGQSGRLYDETDLELAMELAGRAALALDNARLYQEARRALRARDEFLFSISHDLKNPLGAMKGHAQLLRRQVANSDFPGMPPILEALRHIDESAARASALIDELLDLAQIRTQGRLDLVLESVDLVGLVRRLVEEQRRTAERHDLRLEAEVDRLPGRWDPDRIERVVVNLLGNAIKYSPRGGRVTVRLRREGAWAVLEVQDEGLGIPSQDLPHVFERFRRGRNVAGRISGRGIGLSSARQIVEQHGGRLLASSTEGKGSVFTVRLPV